MPSVELVADQRISHRETQNPATQADAVLWWSIVASVLLHIGLTLLFGYFSANTSNVIDSATQPMFELIVIEPVEVETIEIVENEPMQPPEPETTPSEPENTPAPDMQTTVEPVPAIAESTNPDEFDDDLDDDTPAAAAVQINTARIRDQLREQLNASITLPDNAGPGSRILSAERVSVPGMPAAAGWLNNYVGTVEASIERWGNPGGALNARMVLPSGHVVCVQGAAPAHGEIFHIGWPPIAMSRICGRERPTPIDPTRLDTRPMIRPGAGRR